MLYLIIGFILVFLFVTVVDKEACYIYNLMNKGYYYTEKIIKKGDK